MADETRARSAGDAATTAARAFAAGTQGEAVRPGPATASKAPEGPERGASPPPLPSEIEVGMDVGEPHTPDTPATPDTPDVPDAPAAPDAGGPHAPPAVGSGRRWGRRRGRGADPPSATPSTPDADPDAPETRRKVYAALLAVPGLNLSALARAAGVGESLTRYHLGMLMRAELAREDKDGAHARYFPVVAGPLGPTETVDRRDKALVAVLRRAGPLRMVLELQIRLGNRATMGDLARAAGVSPGTATYHIGKLRDLGAIDTVDEGRLRIVVLLEPERIKRLLAKFPPPRDLVQAFTDLWDQVNG